jgi:hypothetical protein
VLVGASSADPKVFAARFFSLFGYDFHREQKGLAEAFLLAHYLDANLLAWKGKWNEINLASSASHSSPAVGDTVDFETQL